MFRDTLIYHYFYRQTNRNNHLRKRFYFLGIAIAISTLFIFQANNSSQIGLQVFSGVSWIFFIVSSMFIPIWATKEIHDEKKSKAFELLLLANTSLYSIVLHKYICFIATICLNVIGTLPIFLFCVIVGGIASHQVFYVYIMLFVFIFFITSVSFFIAITSPIHFGLAGAILFIFTIVFGFSTIDNYFGICISFASLLQNIIFDTPFSIHVVVAYAIIALALIFFTAILAPYFIEDREKQRDWNKKLNRNKAVYYSHNCYSEYNKKSNMYYNFCLISHILASVVLCFACYIFIQNPPHALSLFVWMFVVVFSLVLINASLSFSFATKELELLLLAKITPKDIVLTKQKNVLYSFFSLLSCTYGTFIVYILLFSSWVKVLIIFATIISYPFLLLFFIVYISVYFSAYYQNFVFALGIATIYLIITGFIFTFFYILIILCVPIFGIFVIFLIAPLLLENYTNKTIAIIEKWPEKFHVMEKKKILVLRNYVDKYKNPLLLLVTVSLQVTI